jgi:hypothetical protein
MGWRMVAFRRSPFLKGFNRIKGVSGEFIPYLRIIGQKVSTARVRGLQVGPETGKVFFVIELV